MMKEEDQKAIDEFLAKYKAWGVDYELSYDAANPTFICPGPMNTFLEFDGFHWSAFLGLKVREKGSSECSGGWWRVERLGSVSYGDTPEKAVGDLRRALRIQASLMMLNGEEDD